MDYTKQFDLTRIIQDYYERVNMSRRIKYIKEINKTFDFDKNLRDREAILENNAVFSRRREEDLSEEDLSEEDAEHVQRHRKGTKQYVNWLEKYKRHFNKTHDEFHKGATRAETIKKLSALREQSLKEFVRDHIRTEIKMQKDSVSKAVYDSYTNGTVDRSSIKTIPYKELEKTYERKSEYDGFEGEIFIDTDKKEFVKVVPIPAGLTLEEFLNKKVYAHNILFPEAEYKIEGLTEMPTEYRETAVVLHQAAVNGNILTISDFGDFSDYMKAAGFVEFGKSGYDWALGSIVIEDVTERNVIKTKDNVFVCIDPDIDYAQFV
jgi:hypothetical protein